MNLGHVALLSPEPWDEVWRRNQHLSARLVRMGLAERITFVSPALKLRHRSAFEPEPGIRVVTPHLVWPRSRGGHRVLAQEVCTRFLRSVDVLWINDAPLGIRCLRRGLPALYDVTDDWRAAQLPSSERVRLVAAEDALARSVKTTVCSGVLRDRWLERYGVTAPVIRNGVDLSAHASASSLEMPGPGPHVVYVGSLHRFRLDLDILLRMAVDGVAVTIHLVGPDHLDEASRFSLKRTGRILLHGPVPHADVPRWMGAADVLICPHRVDEFTLSLDAIKSFEYLASGRPVVATPTSGFQSFVGYEGVWVVESDQFVQTTMAVARAPHPPISRERAAGHDWSVRAEEFASALSAAEGPRT